MQLTHKVCKLRYNAATAVRQTLYRLKTVHVLQELTIVNSSDYSQPPEQLLRLQSFHEELQLFNSREKYQEQNGSLGSSKGATNAGFL